jgi:hypothetical protein
MLDRVRTGIPARKILHHSLPKRPIEFPDEKHVEDGAKQNRSSSAGPFGKTKRRRKKANARCCCEHRYENSGHAEERPWTVRARSSEQDSDPLSVEHRRELRELRGSEIHGLTLAVTGDFGKGRRSRRTPVGVRVDELVSPHFPNIPNEGPAMAMTVRKTAMSPRRLTIVEFSLMLPGRERD